MTHSTAIWLRIGSAALAMGMGLSAHAVLTLNPNIEVNVNWREDCDKPLKNAHLGTISASVTEGEKAGAGLKAVFTVDQKNAPNCLFSVMEFHWFQIITQDDDPTGYKGKKDYPLPVVDTPLGGWDYMYQDGAARTKPYDDATNGRYKDDAADTLPWYHTPEEEAGAAGSGNETGGFGKFKRGVSYEIKDGLSGLPDPKLIKFTTWLIATPKYAYCPGTSCLAKGEMLLLGGFDWTMARKEGKIALSATALTSTKAQAALDQKDTGFKGWKVYDGAALCCPEPASLMALALGALALRRRRRA